MTGKENGTEFTHQMIEGDRRIHPRFDVDLPIRYYQPNALVGRIGRAMNVSEGGILIYLPDQMEVGLQLKLRLSFISGTDWENVEAMTEVIWWGAHLWEAWGDYRIGMKFIHMGERDNQKLKDYLKNLSC